MFPNLLIDGNGGGRRTGAIGPSPDFTTASPQEGQEATRFLIEKVYQIPLPLPCGVQGNNKESVQGVCKGTPLKVGVPGTGARALNSPPLLVCKKTARGGFMKCN